MGHQNTPYLLTEKGIAALSGPAPLPVEPAYDGDCVERAARVLASAGRNQYADAVRNLAAITDRLTSDLSEDGHSARHCGETPWCPGCLTEELEQARQQLAAPVRVIVVLDRTRGRVHSITSSNDEARQHVAELTAKHNGPDHAATMTVGLVNRTAAVAVETERAATCATICPDLPFIACTYPAGHPPIPKDMRGVGWRDFEHGNDDKHQVWWNSSTAIATADAVAAPVGNVEGCLCSWSTLTDVPEQVNEQCPHHGGTWRQYTVERDSSDNGVSVLCREDGDCMENSGEDGVAAGRYLTLGEAVDWAKKHAVSIFHVDPDACDACGHDPIECSCELTAADAYPDGRDAAPAAVAVDAVPDDQLCSDKAGFHDGHEYRPAPEAGIVWCPGSPEPERRVAPVKAECRRCGGSGEKAAPYGFVAVCGRCSGTGKDPAAPDAAPVVVEPADEQQGVA
jgi:hypothetical protein